MATLRAHAGDDIIIGDQAYAEEDVTKVLARRLNSIPDGVHETRRYPLGTYKGLTFGIVVNALGAPDAYLEGETTRHAMIARDAGPRAVLNALGRLADGYDGQIATGRKDLAIAEGQLRDYQVRLGQPFAHDAYMAELTRLRDQLKAALSGATPEPGADPLPPASETAERIKALKSAHSIEPSPERTYARPVAAAEEPVTTRIRRLFDLPAAQEPAIGPVLPAPPAESPSAIGGADEPALAPADETILLDCETVQPESRPKTTYRERIVRAERRKARPDEPLLRFAASGREKPVADGTDLPEFLTITQLGGL